MNDQTRTRGNVLIAEDSRIQAKILEQFLHRAGFQVRVAPDGIVALELAHEQMPDVVISDIEMPRMNGYELCRAIKEIPAMSHVPVVLLSTLSDAEDIIKGLDAGADNYVTKPYDPKYLISRLKALLDTPIAPVDDDALELTVTIGGRAYQVRSGRQQTLNLLVSTFENAVEKNRELHRSNEQLALAKEQLMRWNADLETLNSQLTQTNERMARSLATAARVQQSLLPHQDVSLPANTVAWKYQPCDELAGDFLNYFMLDDSHLALFVVDVSGHGTASSLLAVAVGRVLVPDVSATSLLARRDPFTGKIAVTPPSSVVGELNRRFPMAAQGELYFTMTYGVLDTRTGNLRYVSAGHPPMIHVSEGTPRFLPGDNFAVGWIDDVEFDESQVTLRPGDRIYLYSDGLNEVLSERDEQLGDDRLLDLIRGHVEMPLDQSITELLAAANHWASPNKPDDDVSILGCELTRNPR